MNRPRALDLFCGAGGAGMGLHKAGFDVIGVDINKQPRYPFTFVQADALRPPFDLREFDFIWASPPCQFYSSMNHIHKKGHPDLIDEVRAMLKESGRPYCIENVPGAPLINPIRLCGTNFGLRVQIRDRLYELRRHRHFECSFFALQPPCDHRLPVVGVYGNGEADPAKCKRGFQVSNVDKRRELMEMPWANRNEISESIPPAYSEFLGRQAMMVVRGT